MICCVECFKDPEIRGSIESLNHKGQCPICGANVLGFMTVIQIFGIQILKNC